MHLPWRWDVTANYWTSFLLNRVINGEVRKQRLDGLSLMLTLSSHNQLGRSQHTFLLHGKGNSTEQRREVRSEHTGLDRSNFANTQRAFEGRPNWRETVTKLSVIAQRPARKRIWIKMIDSKFSDDLSPYHFVHTIRTDPLLLYFFFFFFFFFLFVFSDKQCLPDQTPISSVPNRNIPCLVRPVCQITKNNPL